MSVLARHLQGAFSDLGWDRGYDFRPDPLDLAGARGLLERLGDLDDSSACCGRPPPRPRWPRPTSTGPAASSANVTDGLEQLARLARMLEEAGLFDSRDGRYELARRASGASGGGPCEGCSPDSQDSLGGREVEHVFPATNGPTSTSPTSSAARSRWTSTRPSATRSTAGAPGTPVRLAPEDFEVEQIEHLSHSATVLMLDLSLSMPMHDNFLAAKKVAVALHPLITSQYTRVPPHRGLLRGAPANSSRPLPEVSSNFSRARTSSTPSCSPTRCSPRAAPPIIMITDGDRRPIRIEPRIQIVFLPLPAGAGENRQDPGRGLTAAPTKGSASTRSC